MVAVVPAAAAPPPPPPPPPPPAPDPAADAVRRRSWPRGAEEGGARCGCCRLVVACARDIVTSSLARRWLLYQQRPLACGCCLFVVAGAAPTRPSAAAARDKPHARAAQAGARFCPLLLLVIPCSYAPASLVAKQNDKEEREAREGEKERQTGRDAPRPPKRNKATKKKTKEKTLKTPCRPSFRPETPKLHHA